MTDYKSLSNDALLAHVDVAGRTLPPELLRVLMARRIDLREKILDNFAASLHDDWEDDDDPRWYRAVHYGFLLIAYRERKALPIFAAIYGGDESHDSLIEWFEDAPANFGPAALPVFQTIVAAAPNTWDFGAAMSISVLETLALRFPEVRQEVVTFLRSRLPALNEDGKLLIDDDAEPDEHWGSIINALTELRDRASMPQALALFDAELIDPMEADRESYLKDLDGAPITEKRQPFDIFTFYTQIARPDAAK